MAKGVKRHHSYGHSGSLSVVDSTASRTRSNYGESYPAGTTIPVRGDFNTLDNPFQYTSDPTGDHYSMTPAAGLHFLMFKPTIRFSITSGWRWMALSKYDTPCFTALNPCGDQLGLADHPPAELPGPTTSPSILSAHRSSSTDVRSGSYSFGPIFKRAFATRLKARAPASFQSAGPRSTDRELLARTHTPEAAPYGRNWQPAAESYIRPAATSASYCRARSSSN